MRGPAFVEIEGDLYVNLAFDLPPLEPDPRTALSHQFHVAAEDLMLLRRLSNAETQVVRRSIRERDAEAWACITSASARFPRGTAK